MSDDYSPDEFLSAKEYAELENLTPRAVRKRAQNGGFKFKCVVNDEGWQIHIDNLSTAGWRNYSSVSEGNSEGKKVPDKKITQLYIHQQLRENGVQNSEGKIFLTAKEVSKYDNVSYSAIKKRLTSGKYESHKIGDPSGGQIYVIDLNSCSATVQRKYWQSRRPHRNEHHSLVKMAKRDFLLTDFSDEEVAELMEKQEWLETIMEAPHGHKENIIRFVCEEFDVHRSTVYHWLNEYKDTNENIRCLAPKSRSDKGVYRSFSPDAVEYMVGKYLTLNQRSKKRAYQETLQEAGEQGWDVGSYATATRIIEDQTKNYLMVYADKGRRGVEENIATPLIREYRDQHPMQLIVGDHARMVNVVWNSQGKLIVPWITAWQDWRTRAIPGRVYSAQPNGQTITLAMQRAIVKEGFGASPTHYGLMSRAYTDRGKDYLSLRITGGIDGIRNHRDWREVNHGSIAGNPKMEMSKQAAGTLRNMNIELPGIFQDLDVEHTVAQAYRSWSKPIERWFRTMHDFCAELPGFIGKKAADRDDTRLLQEYEQDEILTFEEYRHLVDEWIEQGYHQTEHRTLGHSPNQERLEAEREEDFIPTMIDEKALHVLLMKKARRVVSKMGVSLHGLNFVHPDQFYHHGETVVVRYDPENLDRVHVYSEDERKYYYTATEIDTLSMDSTQDEIAAGMARRNYPVKKIAQEYQEKTGGVLKPDNFKKRSFRFSDKNKERKKQEQSESDYGEAVNPLDLLPDDDVFWN